LFGSSGFTFFGPNVRQFTGVEPITAAIRALIHLDTAFGAEKMAVQPHAVATRAVTFAGRVYRNPFVAVNLEERFACHFAFLVDALELERVEPDPAAAVLAHIDDQTADLHFSQFIEASWAFHKASLPQASQIITSQLCVG
jgi:hypothetical protein